MNITKESLQEDWDETKHDFSEAGDSLRAAARKAEESAAGAIDHVRDGAKREEAQRKPEYLDD